jgi:hypothetical protein
MRSSLRSSHRHVAGSDCLQQRCLCGTSFNFHTYATAMEIRCAEKMPDDSSSVIRAVSGGIAVSCTKLVPNWGENHCYPVSPMSSSQEKPFVLVVGATGRTGLPIIKGLVDSGTFVRT